MSTAKAKLMRNPGILLGIVALLVVGFVYTAYGQSNVTKIFNFYEGSIYQEALGDSGSLGAFTTAGTGFTDVRIDNDLTVAGLTTLTGAFTANGDFTATSGSTSLATTTVERFHTGGGLLATSTEGTADTLEESVLLNYAGIAGSYGGGAMTYTLPATSTLTTFIPNAGDMSEFWLMPSPSNAVTIAAGTGIDLVSATSTLTTLADQISKLTFIRATNTDVFVMFEPTWQAD